MYLRSRYLFRLENVTRKKFLYRFLSQTCMKHKLAPDFFRNYNFVLFSDPRDWLQPKMGQQVGFIQNGGMDTH